MGIERRVVAHDATAALAAQPQELAVHVEHVVTEALVQVVDVLADQREHLARRTQGNPQLVQRLVGRVRLRREQAAASLLVEAPHELRIRAPGLWRGDLQRVAALPQAAGVPKGLQPRVRGDAGPREDHQVDGTGIHGFGPRHLSRPARPPADACRDRPRARR